MTKERNQDEQDERDRTPDLDLGSPSVQQCPYAAYAWLRENAPVYHDPVSGMYVVTSYELARQVLRDAGTFSSRAQAPFAGGRPNAPASEHHPFARVPQISATDEPLHAKKRALIDRVFGVERVRKMTPYIDRVVNELIDTFIERGECELMEEFSVPLPCIIIADQIGLSRDDVGRLRVWSDALMRLGFTQLPEEERRACERRMVEGQSHFQRVIRQRRASPKDDLISDLAHAEMDGGRKLDDAELVSLVYELVIGGNETTTSSIASGMKLMLDHPEQLTSIRRDPRLLRTFIEETLRLEAPIQGNFRVATCTTELGGVEILEGAIVHVRTAAANRDGRVFGEACGLDLGRRNAASHLSFGSGIHYCPGALLARQEMMSAFTLVLNRLHDLRYDPGRGSLEYLPSLVQRRPLALWIRFTPRPLPRDGR